MLKDAEIKHQFSCWNKAKDDEMLFVLLERDPAAPETIVFWVNERIRLGLNKNGDNQIIGALACADYMNSVRKQKENKKG